MLNITSTSGTSIICHEAAANRTTNYSDFTQSSRRCDLSLCGFSDLSKFTKTQVEFKLEDSRVVNKMPIQVGVP